MDTDRGTGRNQALTTPKRLVPGAQVGGDGLGWRAEEFGMTRCLTPGSVSALKMTPNEFAT